VAKFLLRTLEFAFYHLLICFVDRLSRLPRSAKTRSSKDCSLLVVAREPSDG
jgi:hypothetical protein